MPTQTGLPLYLDILVSPYLDHPIVGPALLGSGSDAGRFFGWLFGENRRHFDMLSSGERATFQLALALWNGNREAVVADLFAMDDAHQHRAGEAIAARLGFDL